MRVLHSLSRLRTLLKWNEDGGLSENMNFQESRFNIEQSARNPFCKFRKSAFYGKTIGWGCRISIVPVTRKYVSVAAHPFTLGTTNGMQGNTNKYKCKSKYKNTNTIKRVSVAAHQFAQGTIKYKYKTKLQIQANVYQ